MGFSGFRSKIALSSRRRLAVAVMAVAILGVITGAYAVTVTISQVNFSGEQGTYHNNSGSITAVDNGLAPVANAVSANITSAVTWGSSGTNKRVYNAMVAGDLMDYITFSTSLADGSTHAVTVTVRNGTGALGTTVVSVTSGTWTAPSSSSTATITMYIDLGTQSASSPITVYITVS